MSRFAAVDVGSNSVKLLVAERGPDGAWVPLSQRTEVTRLGRGVDQTGALAPERMAATLEAVTSLVSEARSLGARDVAAVGTSAARDARNGAEFLSQLKAATGLELEILSGDDEARLCFLAVQHDFGRQGNRPVVAVDVGGGSTEIIYGTPEGTVQFRHSFDVGSVRLTERHVRTHPVPSDQARALRDEVTRTFAALPPPPADARVVGVSGTPTTLYAALEGIEPYDPDRVHGAEMTTAALLGFAERLAGLTVEQRIRTYRIHPGRADVLCAGAWILGGALDRLGANTCVVSDRGVRWGLLYERFGST